MPRDDFYRPTDADALRMENELLAYEVRFLRAMLADPLAQIEEHKTRLQNTRQELDQMRQENASLRERNQQQQRRNKRQEEARSDLIRLLESMSGGATELVHRRNEVFNELKERYL